VPADINQDEKDDAGGALSVKGGHFDTTEALLNK
jgi:hypothetical protein